MTTERNNTNALPPSWMENTLERVEMLAYMAIDITTDPRKNEETDVEALKNQLGYLVDRIVEDVEDARARLSQPQALACRKLLLSVPPITDRAAAA